MKIKRKLENIQRKLMSRFPEAGYIFKLRGKKKSEIGPGTNEASDTSEVDNES